MNSEIYQRAVRSINEVQSFLEQELTSSSVLCTLDNHKNDLNLFEEGHYFELVGYIPDDFSMIECICAKSYTDSGLCLIIIYFEGVFYSVLSDISDDEPLLDVDFPDVSQEGDGITLTTYDDVEGQEASKESFRWLKLSIWQTRSQMDETSSYESSQVSIVSLPSVDYAQTYCILKPSINKGNKSNRDVLFRFGNWCYAGEVELIDKLNVQDIPHVIPALRIQQHNLAFLSSVSELPHDNVFSETLMENSRIMNLLESEILSLESQIEDIENKLCPTNKLQQESINQFFFEFNTNCQNCLPSIGSNVDLIATKTYRPNGLVVMTIYFSGTYYVCISDGDGCDQPLLDCDFPPVIQGKGYNVKTYPNGLESFPELRRLKIWQNSKNYLPNSIDEPKDLVCKGDSQNISKEEISVQSLDVDQCDSSDCLQGKGEEKHVPSNFKDQNENHPDTSRTCDDESKHSSIDYKNITQKSVMVQGTHSRKKKNYGAFHHLAPLNKSAHLGQKVNSMKHDLKKRKIPYDQTGKPL